MSPNPPTVIALAMALVSPEQVWSAMRPRSGSWRGNVGLFAEMFVTVVVAAFLTRHARDGVAAAEEGAQERGDVAGTGG